MLRFMQRVHGRSCFAGIVSVEARPMDMQRTHKIASHMLFITD